MAPDFEDKREEQKIKAYANRRAILDYGMGVLYIAAGLFLFLSDQLGFALDFPKVLSGLLGGLFLVYGGFRIYRGYKKNYFR
jgi:hypothetical protein